MAEVTYNEDNIKSLDWKEHIRMRPGMYIGKLGDGSSPDDGVYILLKEIIDNCIDEYVMGHGKKIELNIEDGIVSVRDYGRGIPLGKVVDCVSKINTGGKYDSKAFKKSVGLNGVGTKAVNALSERFVVKAVRENKAKVAEFSQGVLGKESKIIKAKEFNGTYIEFEPDRSIFKNYKYRSEYVESQLWNYAYLNAGLKIIFNGKTLYSKNGLLDLLTRKTFVNGQHTTQGGTHLQAFREAIVKTVRDFFGKNFDSKDIHTSIIGAISVRVEEPVFESQTKTKLGSLNIGPKGPSAQR